MIAQPFRHRRRFERTAQSLMHFVAKARRADAEHLQAVAHIQRHRVAFEPVTPGLAAGRNGSRRGSRGRGKDTAVGLEMCAGFGDPDQVGGNFRRHHIGAEPVTNYDHNTFHRLRS